MRVRILKNLNYPIYWDEENKTVYVRSNLKVKHINGIRLWLISSGFNYKNLIIGQHFEGES